MFATFRTIAVALGVTTIVSMAALTYAAEDAVVVPAIAADVPKAAGEAQVAVFAGGCFWGVQGVFQHVRGVTKAVSGYAGGEAKTARYESVGSGRTGHAESVQVTFDPAVVSYGELLQIFFSVVHDPTQLNRQGPDTGTQYRSEIFYTSEAQKKTAEAYIAQLNEAKVFSRPIVTRVDSLPGFYAAEAYHQDYLTENPRNPYIVYNDLPKVANLKKFFPEQYRGTPVLVKTASAQ